MVKIHHACEPFSRLTLVLAISSALTTTPITLLAAPTDGVVVSGSAVIGQSGGVTNITQHTPKAAIDWEGFSLSSGEAVNFHQPNSSSITLNRVLGNERSVIEGALNANGQIFLINSNGVLFTKGSSVNAAGLVASTLDISNADFEASRYVFQGSNGSGSVINMGALSAADGGYVALLGKEALNQGAIFATRGTAALSAGEQITLNFNGDSLLNVSIDQGALDALVENRQAIYADGGKVFLTARAADEVLGSQVNNSGLIEAHTLGDLKGEIVAHAYGGSANIGGTLDASAPNGGDGGFIETSGDKVKIADSAFITTQAAAGNTGNWLIDPDGFTIAAAGGDITGTAVSKALASNNIKFASTQGRGSNGDINVNDRVNWSAHTILGLIATHNININAPISGANGGLSLRAGAAVNFNAPTSASVATLTATAGGNVNFNAPQFWTAPGAWTFSGKNINVNDAVSWSEGLVTLNAAKFININAVMTASNNARLVAAYNTGRDTSRDAKGVPTSSYGTPLGGINPLFDDKKQEFLGRIDFVNDHVLNPLTINGHQYTLITSIGASGAHDMSIIDAHEGKGFYALATDLKAPTKPFFNAPISVLGGLDANLQSTPAALEGLGHAIRNLNINTPEHDFNSTGLIGNVTKGSLVNNLNLANINVKHLSADNGDVGTLTGRNNGFISNSYASGTLNVSAFQTDGDGSTVSGVNNIGGFAGYNDGTIYHSGSDVDVTTKNAKFVGGFVGTNWGAAGIIDFGPLTGQPWPFGVILDSYARGDLNVTMANYNIGWAPTDDGGFGGFVGTNYSLISGSSSSGTITAVLRIPSGTSSDLMGNIGGFAGVNSEGFSNTHAIISNSTSSSSVTGTVVGGVGSFNDVGGFVGQNGSTDHAQINNSSAFGSVRAPSELVADIHGNLTTTVGGFAGINPGGAFSGNTFNAATTGQSAGIGMNNSNSNSGISSTTNTQPSSTQGRLPSSQAQLARDARAKAQALTGQATTQRADVAAQQQAAVQAVVASTASQLGSTRVAEVQRNASSGILANANISTAATSSNIDDNIISIEPANYSAHVQSIEVDGVTYDLDEEDEKEGKTE